MQAVFSGFKRVFPSAMLLAVFAFPAPSAATLLITDDMDMQGAGNHQLELSFNRDRTRNDGDTLREHSVPLVYTYGLADSLDVYVGVEHKRLRGPEERASGFGNSMLGLKWRFFENEDSGTSLGLRPEIVLPVSAHRENRGLGTGKTSASLTLILSQDVPFGSVHFNAGVGRDRYRRSEDHDNASATTRHLSVAPVWDISERWQLALDVGADWARSQGRTVRSRFTEIAVAYSPNENIELTLGFVRTTDNNRPQSRTNGMIVGMTWCF